VLLQQPAKENPMSYPMPSLEFSPKRRTICADCRWVLIGPTDSTYTCGHENARNLITGTPNHCFGRNHGNCPDFDPKP